MNTDLDMINPFLDPSFEIRWSELTPDRVKPAIETALAEAQERIDAIGENGALDFDNTFLALEEATEDLSLAWQKVSHLDTVCNSEPLREVHNEMLPKVTEFWARIPLNDKLWNILRRYAESEEGKVHTGVERRFIDETVADFRGHGADLPPDKKKRLEELSKELAEKTQKYSENVLDSTNAYELVIDDESLLDGLPDRSKEQARRDALEKGYGTEENPKWRLTQQMPSILPAMKHLHNEGIRKELWQGSARIGHSGDHDNTELIWQILALRDEKARLLGKEHFADLVLQRRMAKTGQTALSFVEDFHDRVKAAFDRECTDLEDYRARNRGEEQGPIEPWDSAYWSEKLRREEFDFDDESLRPYFPIEQVEEGMFRIAERIFDIRVEERPTVFRDPDGAEDRQPTPPDSSEGTVETWHPEVRCYDVLNSKSERIGAFYTDWYPREPKRGGAWMNYLLTGRPPDQSREGSEREPHLGLICGNLSPPIGDSPALLTHDEVQTIFHEFGHLLHHLLGEVPIKSLNGINVAWDFVELPSQIMENWCWDRESLDLFARHHETGEPIPDDLFDKMHRARNFQSARFTMRQLSFGKMDLELHLHYPDYKGEDLDAQLESMLASYQPPSKTKAPAIIRRFSHLFSGSTGYAAGYYSYKWAEVLDADAFTRFQAKGVLDPKMGMEFREKVLSKGNSEDPAVLFRDFMGREPEIDALLERSRLAQSGSK